MTVSIDEGLGAMDRIIARAAERRVEHMIHIAVLLADEKDPTDAQAELARIERLLRIMRTQRTLLIRSCSLLFPALKTIILSIKTLQGKRCFQATALRAGIAG